MTPRLHQFDDGARHEAASAPGGVVPRRVLVVDDSQSVRQLVADLVHDSGATVVAQAEDGEEAVAAALAFRPDIVIMDSHMPVMDGVAATAAIVERVPGTEVIAFSSADEDDVAEAFLRAGAVAYVDKANVLELLRHIRSRVSARPNGPGA
jgi:CheY-like chemotaxis protein